MNYLEKNGYTYCTFSLFSSFPEVFAAVSTRTATDGQCRSFSEWMTPLKEQELCFISESYLYNALNLTTDTIARIHQIHSNTVIYAQSTGFLGNGDGMVTDKKGIFLRIVTADCLSIFLYDPHRKIIGLVHAGWRGVLQNIIASTVRQMELWFDTNPQEVFAAVGPFIQRCCYRVKEDVASKFDEDYLFHRRRFFQMPMQESIYRLDLGAVAQDQLLKKGISACHIEIADECTFCRDNLFHSARRDKGKTGRNVSLFALQY